MVAKSSSSSRESIESRRNADRDVGRNRAWMRLLLIGGGLFLIVGALVGVRVFATQHQASISGGMQFVIPAGASKDVAIPTIDSAIDIPTHIVFKAGEPAILTIRNDDSVANRAGPWVIGPGQTYTAKFDQPGTYDYACTVDPAESVTIVVEGPA